MKHPGQKRPNRSLLFSLHGTDKAGYTSMPKDNGTLDYIIAPAATFDLSDVACPTDYVSDHRAVLANIVVR